MLQTRIPTEQEAYYFRTLAMCVYSSTSYDFYDFCTLHDLAIPNTTWLDGGFLGTSSDMEIGERGHERGRRNRDCLSCTN